jgi:hypothetical protein
MALFRFPILPDDRLVGSLKNPPFEIQARLANHDRLTNPAEVWSSLDNELRPSVSYILTLALDPWKEVTGPVVRTLTLRAGQAGDLPRQPQFIPGSTNDQMIFIGGTLRDKSKDAAPLSGVQVAIKGTGLITTTDAEGQLHPGQPAAG